MSKLKPVMSKLKPVLKVKIRKNRAVDGSGTKFHWPGVFIEASNDHGVNPVAYEDTGAVGSGVSEYAVVVVTKEEWYDRLVADRDIEPISPETANILGQMWRPKVTLITDETEIINILRKVKAGDSLTDEEQASIDEEDQVPGILTKRFNIFDYI